LQGGSIQRNFPFQNGTRWRKKPIFHSDPQALFKVISVSSIQEFGGEQVPWPALRFCEVSTVDFAAAQHEWGE
jgi:hypothetical protein